MKKIFKVYVPLALLIASVLLIHIANISKAQAQLILELKLENVDISTGDLIAPHLYTWQFTGIEEQHLRIPWEGSPSTVAFAIAVKSSWPGKTQFIVFRRRGTESVGQFDFYYGLAPIGVREILIARIARPISVSDVHVYDGVPLEDRWLHIFVDYNTSYYANLYVNETDSLYLVSGGVPLSSTFDPLYIGARGDQAKLSDVRDVFAGNIRWFILWDNSEASTVKMFQAFREMTKKKIIHAGNVVMFFDPTFVTGKDYKDIVGGYIAINNSVARVRDTEKWLWLLKKLYRDRYLHIGWLDQLPVPDGGGVRIIMMYGGHAYELWLSKDEIVSGEYLIDLVKIFGTPTLSGATIKVQVWSERIIPVEVVTTTIVTTVATKTVTTTITQTVAILTSTVTSPVPTTTTATVTTPTTIVTTVEIPATTTVTIPTTITTVETGTVTLTSTVTSPVPTTTTATVTTPTTIVTTVEIPATTTVTIPTTIGVTYVRTETVVQTLTEAVPTTVVSPTTVTERTTEWIAALAIGMVMLVVGIGISWLILTKRE